LYPAAAGAVTMVKKPFKRGIVSDRILQHAVRIFRGQGPDARYQVHDRRDCLAIRTKAAARVLFRHSWTVRGVRFCDG
jgi:hypothetical protein